MSKLYDVMIRQALYWLTDRRANPPRYIRLWVVWGIFAFVMFLVGQKTLSLPIKVLSISFTALWGLVLLMYIFWEILRRFNFLKFKRMTQKKDKPFTVKMLSSERKLRPRNYKGAG